ncbi:MAG: superoxide dismutase [Sulfurimonas sp.]|uniref:superoxide dismutase n=1 Tax=Sulfurimonas sp. TaxID=2022749 RepID=UPI00260C5CB7|nr:superoxide dismutase [Sulfurimonas sp.]MDD5400104.1 superoxide dismutase [Sulfurimonas sp.]
MIELPKLPFAENELEPFLSAQTLQYHYGKHHAAYVNKLNELIKGTEFDKMSLSSIIRDSEGAVFNNAAQVFNHTFYWNCLSGSKSAPSGKFLLKINNDFGSLEALKEEFIKAGTTLFGSGWVWLVREPKGQLMIKQTANAHTPLSSNLIPLFVCDVWEHAYYIDYRNLRLKYLEEFWNHINWDFATKAFEKTDNEIFIGIEPCNDIHDSFCQILDDIQNQDRVTS